MEHFFVLKNMKFYYHSHFAWIAFFGFLGWPMCACVCGD